MQNEICLQSPERNSRTEEQSFWLQTYKVAIGGELVGNELRIDEFVADNIGEKENGGGCILGFRIRKVR
jgi:hypothetical protein